MVAHSGMQEGRIDMGLLDRDYARLTPAEQDARVRFAARRQTRTQEDAPIPVTIVTPWSQIIGQLLAIALLIGLCVIAGHLWWGW
jgi:hypothetical protein